jgi:hypothetical protein
VVSRLIYALHGLASLVTRAVDGIISIPFTVISLLTLGKFGFINHVAFSFLSFTGIINDLFKCTLGIINPITTQANL